MAVLVAQRTLNQVVKEAMRLAGYLVGQGTATAGTTTSLTDANNYRLVAAQSGFVTSKFLYFDASLPASIAGLSREVSSYGTLGVFTWILAVADAPTTSTTWLLCSRRPQDMIDAIAECTRNAAIIQGQNIKSKALVTNSLLSFAGDFEDWPSGTSSAPEDWVLSGAGAAVAQSTTFYAHGLNGVQVSAGAGADGVLTFTVPFEDLRELDGKTVKVRGLLAPSTGGAPLVRLAYTNSAGTATNTNWTGTYSGNRWQELEDITPTGAITTADGDITLPDPLSALTLACRIPAADSTCYFDDLMLVPNVALYKYKLPQLWTHIGQTIFIESAYKSGIFRRALVHGKDWHVQQGSSTPATNAYLVLHEAQDSYLHLEIEARRAPVVQTTATSNVEPDAEWLALAAAVRCLKTDPKLDEDKVRRLKILTTDLERMERSSKGNTMIGKGGDSMIPLVR